MNHVQGLIEKGAQITGMISFTAPVTALTPQQLQKKYDYIFLMSKQLDNIRTVTFLKQYFTSDGILCSFQNGISEYQIASILGEEKAFGCSVATLTGNGVCELTSDPNALTFSIGKFGNQDNRKLNQIKEILETVGSVTIESNFIGARWSWNMSIITVC